MLFVLLASSPVPWFLVLIIILVFQFFRNAGSQHDVEIRPIRPFNRQILDAYFDYYKNLDEENKRRFEGRVQTFIDSNEFIPRGIPRVTDEMQTLIAGAAIQLTFGFKHLNFAHFEKILVYPNDYYSLITRKYHQGEVNPRGLIVLSWKSFQAGYKDPADGRNLALHEMAHALRLENAIHNEEFDFIPKKYLDHFDRLAKDEIRLLKSGEGNFFRKYGSTNLHEFFAVAVENFFERPVLFLEEKPDIYIALSKLLNQDPVRLFKLGN